MNITEYLLTCLAEECDEVGQRAAKCGRFGMTDVQEGHEADNTERLIWELNDLWGVVALLVENHILPASFLQPSLMEAKKRKVLAYMQYSRDAGTLHDAQSVATLTAQMKHLAARKLAVDEINIRLQREVTELKRRLSEAK